MGADGVVILGPDEGRFLAAAGTRIRVKLSARDVPGGPEVIQLSFPPGLSSPSHVHAGTDHAVFVVAGDLRLELEGRAVDAGTGTFFYVPRGVPHGLSNPGTEVVTLLQLDTGSPLEPMFEGLANSFPSAD